MYSKNYLRISNTKKYKEKKGNNRKCNLGSIMRNISTHNEKRRYWNGLIAQWEQSALTQSEFCQQHGLLESNFSKWKAKLRPRLKRSPSKQLVSKQEFWQQHLESWSKSSLTQAQYCKKQKLSKSAFSKWKLKLRPAWTKKQGGHNFSFKNKYGKNLKLTENQIERLAKYFFARMHVAKAAKLLKLSRKTVYRYYKHFNHALFNGAAHYPQLFFGAGAILTLGPSPISQATVNVDRKRVSKMNEAIMRYSSLRWSLAEIYLLLVTGVMLNYQKIFAPQNGLDPKEFNKDILRLIISKKSYAIIIAENWAYCESNNLQTLWPTEYWLAILHKRNYVDYKFKYKQMVRDFLWILKNNSLNSPSYFVDINPYFKIMPNTEEADYQNNQWRELAEKIKTGEVIFEAGK